MPGFLSSLVGGTYGPAVQLVAATGGTISDITVAGINYRTHRFTNTGNNTFTVSAPGFVDILLVGGGSAGSAGPGTTFSGGGGGAGGVLRRHYLVAVTAQAYTITVGERGFASHGSGVNSTGLTFTATGGLSTAPATGVQDVVQKGRNNADFSGGAATAATFAAGNGGAGAGGNGLPVNAGFPGNGGPGAVDATFTSISTTYGGGGGGGGVSSGAYNNSSGGSGGGGGMVNGNGQGGTDGLGGGGGGSNRNTTSSAGAGGSGIVIIRYAL